MRKNNIRRVLILILGTVFIISCGNIVLRFIDARRSEMISDEAEQLAGISDFSQPEFTASDTREPIENIKDPDEPETYPEPEEPSAQDEPEPAPEPAPDPYADALAAMDFAALRKINTEVKGWITIPGTNISYPLLQGSDNSYYLAYNWRRGRSLSGSIFIDYRCGNDMQDFNTIIYGHRMSSGTMFSRLNKYKDSAYLASHPEVYIATDNGSFKYRIFSTYEASVSEGYTYEVDFPDDRKKQNFIDFCVQNSVHDTGIIPEINDNIITLSTCTGNGHATRWVVHAVLIQ